VFRKEIGVKQWSFMAETNGTLWRDTTFQSVNASRYVEYAVAFEFDGRTSELSPIVKCEVFADNFDDNVNRWFQPSSPEDDSSIVSGGSLTMFSKPGRIMWTTVGENRWRNMSVEADVEFIPTDSATEASGIALLGRFSHALFLPNETKFYAGTLFRDGYVTSAGYSGDTWFGGGGQATTTDPAVVHHMRYTVWEDSMTVFVDGVRVIHVQSAQMEFGKAGIAVQGGIAARFDNVVITVGSSVDPSIVPAGYGAFRDDGPRSHLTPALNARFLRSSRYRTWRGAE
jgi:hypothetical protein